MKRRFLSIIILLFVIVNNNLGQKTITGSVFLKEFEEEEVSIGGVVITEKGTSNSTTSDIDGRFNIIIADTSNVLVFSFIGCVTREVILNDILEIEVSLKPYIHYEAWDQKIRLFLNSGVINNPFGVGIGFIVPISKTSFAINSSISYQSNLISNQAITASLEFKRIRLSPLLGLSFETDFRHIIGEENYIQNYYSIESKWLYLQNSLSIGYGHINLEDDSFPANIDNAGLVAGFSTFLGDPLYVTVGGKVAIFRDLTEYHGEIEKRFKRIYSFIKYYKSKSYSELSIGIGIEFTYMLRYQKNSNRYATQH
jgi:hypothetical protein